jgi:hypothetical protein
MADKATKEQVYAMLGKYLTGELKGHIDGLFCLPGIKMRRYGWLIHQTI